MKRTIFSLIIAAALLAGCTASQRHLSSDYGGYGFNTVEAAGGRWKVVDNPEKGLLFVLPTPGYVLGHGTPPEAEARAAALTWLEKTRRDCTITQRRLYQEPHWEFQYHCRR